MNVIILTYLISNTYGESALVSKMDRWTKPTVTQCMVSAAIYIWLWLVCDWMGWFSDSNIVYHGDLGSYKVYWLEGIYRKDLMIINLVGWW